MGGSAETYEDEGVATSEAAASNSEQNREADLKYLNFVKIAASYGSAFAFKVYVIGKENSGTYKQKLESVEEKVIAVISPICEKMEGKPLLFLQFADRKVDDIIQMLNEKMPGVTEKTFQVLDSATTAGASAARSLATDIQQKGVSQTTADIYSQYAPIAGAYGCQAWHSFMKLPLAPQAMGTVRMGADKLNQLLVQLRESQAPLAAYVPLLPVDKLDSALKAHEEQFQVK